MLKAATFLVVILTELFLSSTLLTKTIKASDILFEDNFNDGNDDGWERHSTSGSWLVQNSGYIGSATYTSSSALPSYSLAGDQTWQSYRLELDINGSRGIDKQVLFHVNKVQNRSYIFNFRSNYFNGGNDAILAKRQPIGTQDAILLKATSFISSPNTSYHVAVEVKNFDNNSVQISIYVDSVLIIQHLDVINPILNGGIGLEVVPGGYEQNPVGLTTETVYDNIQVFDSQPKLSVPNIKQFDPNWKNILYDSANVWSPRKTTIERWGCALTSAAMVMNYYGHTITPAQLNTYLQQNNGYTRNGGVVWGKISKYTKDHEDANKPSLEFTRLEYNSANVESTLAAKEPPIVKLLNATNNTHFVVLTGKNNDTFNMNDPATTNELLSFYTPSSYNSIEKFTPSHTDLSGIYLYFNKNISVKVYRPDNTEVTEGFSFEYPLENQVEHTQSQAETLKTFYLAKPQPGIYKVEISGNSTYKLDSYLFNKDGVSTDQKYSGTLKPNGKETYYITIGEKLNVKKFSFEYVIEMISRKYNSGDIKSKQFYQLLKSSIEAAQKAYDKNKIFLSRSLLQASIFELNIAKTKIITTEANKELKSLILSLIEVL